MGVEGLKKVSQVVIFNVNYIVSCLQDVFLVLYIGCDGCVVYECIFDICLLKEEIGISELDIVKCLIDYGFYVLMMLFLVVGMLMVELIEFESKVELDCFIDVMLVICVEIDQVKVGVWLLEDNLLVNVLYIQNELVVEWVYLYSCEVVVFLVGVVDKYWLMVKCLDDVYGDCNLFCFCVLISEYQ